jgi:hypothetical protein
LHTVHMDVRAPTHELTPAHAVVRARPPDWALGPDGLRQLIGRCVLAGSKQKTLGKGRAPLRSKPNSAIRLRHKG